MHGARSLLFFTLILFGLLVTAQSRAETTPAYTQAELDQMLAPIALYPDTVLSHVLIAATYPLEVIEAARWSIANPDLRGEEAVTRVENEDWDASVKALVAFPDLLQRMSEDLDWTRNLGEAFLVQEGDVADTVQYLRNDAYESGHLETTEQVRVVRETRYIYIEPARPQYVYIPYYDPYVVYGSWRYAAYPPVYWPRPPGLSIGVSFYWGSRFSIAPSFYFSAFHWPVRQVVVVNHHHYRGGYFQRPYHAFHGPPRHRGGHGPRRWHHDPGHRRGVDYRHTVAEDRFVASSKEPRHRTMPVRDDRRTDQRAVAASFSRPGGVTRSTERRAQEGQPVRSASNNRSDKGRSLDHRTQPVRSASVARSDKGRSLEQRTQPVRSRSVSSLGQRTEPVRAKPVTRSEQRSQPVRAKPVTRSEQRTQPVRSASVTRSNKGRSLEQRTQPVRSKPEPRSQGPSPSVSRAGAVRADQPTSRKGHARAERPIGGGKASTNQRSAPRQHSGAQRGGSREGASQRRARQ